MKNTTAKKCYMVSNDRKGGVSHDKELKKAIDKKSKEEAS